MKLKANWNTYLHNLRRREIELIYSKCPKHCFVNGLELGAGDGFQSTLLAYYTSHLMCTEYNEERLIRLSTKNITYKICDAEYIDQYFKPQSFDLVFSSNLLEHLKQQEKVLQKLHRILTDDGVCISVMPNPFIKICWIGLFYPNQLVDLAEILTKPDGPRKVFRELYNRLFYAKSSQEILMSPNLSNNPKSPPKNFLQRYLWPTPHGEYSSNLEEFFAYRKKTWITLIENQGFDVTTVLKMPVVSGYGFGLDALRNILEKMGFSSSYAYIAFKKRRNSSYRRYWGI